MRCCINETVSISSDPFELLYVSARSEGREGLDGKKATWVQLRFLG